MLKCYEAVRTEVFCVWNNNCISVDPPHLPRLIRQIYEIIQEDQRRTVCVFWRRSSIKKRSNVVKLGLVKVSNVKKKEHRMWSIGSRGRKGNTSQSYNKIYQSSFAMRDSEFGQKLFPSFGCPRLYVAFGIAGRAGFSAGFYHKDAHKCRPRWAVAKDNL